MKFAIVFLVSITLTLMPALAQVGPAGVAAPGMEAPTKLEALELRKSTVIVKGYTEVGKVEGEDGSSVNVSAIEIKDATRGTKEMGLAIVAVQGGEGRRQAISYVDFDEIGGLLTAIDYLAKPD